MFMYSCKERNFFKVFTRKYYKPRLKCLRPNIIGTIVNLNVYLDFYGYDIIKYINITEIWYFS